MSLLKGPLPIECEQEEKSIRISVSSQQNKDIVNKNMDLSIQQQTVIINTQEISLHDDDDNDDDFQTSEKKSLQQNNRFQQSKRRALSRESQQNKQKYSTSEILNDNDISNDIQIQQQQNVHILHSQAEEPKSIKDKLNSICLNSNPQIQSHFQPIEEKPSLIKESSNELSPENKDQSLKQSTNLPQINALEQKNHNNSSLPPLSSINKNQNSIFRITEDHNFSSKTTASDLKSSLENSGYKQKSRKTIAKKGTKKKEIQFIENSDLEHLETQQESKEINLGSLNQNYLHSLLSHNQHGTSMTSSDHHLKSDYSSTFVQEKGLNPTHPNLRTNISVFDSEKTFATEQEDQESHPIEIIKINRGVYYEEEIDPNQFSNISPPKQVSMRSSIKSLERLENRQFSAKKSSRFQSSQKRINFCSSPISKLTNLTKIEENNGIPEFLIQEFQQKDTSIKQNFSSKQSASNISQTCTLFISNEVEKKDNIERETLGKNAPQILQIQNDSNVNESSQVTFEGRKTSLLNAENNINLNKKLQCSSHESSISAETIKLQSISKNFGEKRGRDLNEEKPEVIEYSDKIKQSSQQTQCNLNFLSLQENDFNQELENIAILPSVEENQDASFSKPSEKRINEDYKEMPINIGLDIEVLDRQMNIPIMFSVEESQKITKGSNQNISKYEDNNNNDIEIPQKKLDFIFNNPPLNNESNQIQFSSLWKNLIEVTERQQEEFNCSQCFLSIFYQTLTNKQRREKELIIRLSEELYSDTKTGNVELLEHVRFLYKKFTTTTLSSLSRKHNQVIDEGIAQKQLQINVHLNKNDQDQDKHFFSKKSSMRLQEMNIFSLIQMLAFLTSDGTSKLALISKRLIKKVNLLFLLLKVSSLVANKIKENVLDNCLKSKNDEMITIGNQLFTAVYSEAVSSVANTKLEPNQTNIKLYDNLSKITKQLNSSESVFQFLSSASQRSL